MAKTQPAERGPQGQLKARLGNHHSENNLQQRVPVPMCRAAWFKRGGSSRETSLTRWVVVQRAKEPRTPRQYGRKTDDPSKNTEQASNDHRRGEEPGWILRRRAGHLELALIECLNANWKGVPVEWLPNGNSKLVIGARTAGATWWGLECRHRELIPRYLANLFRAGPHLIELRYNRNDRQI